MYARTAKKAEKDRQRAAEHQQGRPTKGQLKVSILMHLERGFQTPTSIAEVVKGQRRSARYFSNKDV